MFITNMNTFEILVLNKTSNLIGDDLRLALGIVISKIHFKSTLKNKYYVLKATSKLRVLTITIKRAYAPKVLLPLNSF